MKTALAEALHSTRLAKAELQDAIGTSDSVQALVLMPLIRQATELESGIKALLDAAHASKVPA